MNGRFSPKSALLFALVTLISVNFGFCQSSNRRPLSEKKALSSLHCLQHIKNSGLLRFNGGAKDKWKFRGSELPIMTSKTYAQFETSAVETDFIQTYSVEILLNKYQVTPKSQPIHLRSRSVFYFQPCFRTNWHCLNNSVLELEYSAGLQLASNAEVEKIVEFKTDKRLFGIVGWIGKVGFKFHLHRLAANHKSQ